MAGLAEEARARRGAAEAAIRRGELAAGLDALRDELALRRRVLELDPDDVQARESVARTAARLADVLVFRSSLAGLHRGETAGADGAAALTGARRQREVAWTLRSVGGTLEARGDLAGALALYREGLDVRRRLAAGEPGNADLMLDITYSLSAIAQALLALGDFTEALAKQNEALAMRRELADRDPANSRRRLDLSWSLMALADVLEAKGEPDGALAALRESLAIRRALLAADAGNDGLGRDVAASLVRIGEVLAAAGDRAGAHAAFSEARDIVCALAARGPDGATLSADIAVLGEWIAALAQPPTVS
jgi:tetratricopeptide (TPR) repeat protein